MFHDFIIFLPVWLALLGWFAGSFAGVRSRSRAVCARCYDNSAEAVYRYAWLFGAAMIVLHIVASYGIASGWSDSTAVLATAAESERVTGIRAGLEPVGAST